MGARSTEMEVLLGSNPQAKPGASREMDPKSTSFVVDVDFRVDSKRIA
jgi:hypothetical protein